MAAAPAPRYVAFISYNHADRSRARWLHRAIESFAVPRMLQGGKAPYGTIGPRVAPVFMDREELPSSPDLAASVRDALERSEFLIVVCSPQSARSRWVNEEVRVYKSLGRADRILTLIVAGEPRANTGPEDAVGCFPPALAYVVEDGVVSDRPASEPLAADVRPGGDPPRLATLKILAALLGVPFDDLRRREQTRRQRRLAIVATAATVGCLVMGALAAYAWLARAEAERQRAIAEQKTQTAQRTTQFLKSLFKVSDPSEARGNAVTAREILDRGAQQLSTELRDEPLVRAELATTLGEVYTSLGLWRPGRELLDGALAVPSQPPETVARQQVALAFVDDLQGDFPAADALYEKAAPVYARIEQTDPGAYVDMLRGWGETLGNLDRFDAARDKLQRAAALAEARFGRTSEPYAAALEGIAYVSFYANDLQASKAEFESALRIRTAVSGADHPKVLDTLNQLGAVEYMLGDREAAAGHLRQSLELGRRIQGARNAGLAPRINNLGRIELEQRHFGAAVPLLEEALDLYLSQQDESDENVTFTLANLAIARAATGRSNDADALYARALRSASATHHRLEGPILVDWADLDCRRGRVAEGLDKLARARPLSAERYPNDPWRVALVDSVQAGCELRRRRADTAERLLVASGPALFAKWPPDTLYGYDAVRRNIELYERLSRPDKVAEFRRQLR